MFQAEENTETLRMKDTICWGNGKRLGVARSQGCMGRTQNQKRRGESQCDLLKKSELCLTGNREPLKNCISGIDVVTLFLLFILVCEIICFLFLRNT